MAFLFGTQIVSSFHFPMFLGTFKFVGIGFFLSLLLLWLFVQILVWLAERYSRLISGTQWWRSGVIAAVGMIVGIFSWQIPGMSGEEEALNVVSAMTSALIFGTVFGWFLCGKLYEFEFLHRLIVAIAIPILVFCALALGKVLEWKMAGL